MDLSKGDVMDYRRVYVEGGCYFFTVTLADRKSDLLVQHIDCLRSAFKTVKQKHPFEINAMVVMPDHLHCLWTLPKNDSDYSTRWALIKANFSRAITKTELIKATRLKKGERGIWQRRFWEHTIRDDQDFYNHIEYIHNNPIKHGYVSNAQDWPYSSIHQFA
jgi:putative transposase